MHEHVAEPVTGSARATLCLEPNERTLLGLPEASAVQPGALPPLDEEQWAGSAIVAVRFALVRSNYRATEDPAVVRARSAPHVVPRLQADSASPGGGEAELAESRAKGTAFGGDVVGLVTSERYQNRALVDLTIKRFFVDDGAPDPERVFFWRLTLVRDQLKGHWQVADLRLS